MSEERIKDWIVRQFKDKDADPSEMENWLLENSENPQFDTIMQELLDDVDYYDPVDSSRGYSLFRTKKGFKLNHIFTLFDNIKNLSF